LNIFRRNPKATPTPEVQAGVLQQAREIAGQTVDSGTTTIYMPERNSLKVIECGTDITDLLISVTFTMAVGRVTEVKLQIDAGSGLIRTQYGTPVPTAESVS